MSTFANNRRYFALVLLALQKIIAFLSKINTPPLVVVVLG
jgi:hypothetical protein